MNDAMYNLGNASFWGVIIFIVLSCINKIRKNHAEIRRLEKDEKSKRK